MSFMPLAAVVASVGIMKQPALPSLPTRAESTSLTVPVASPEMAATEPLAAPSFSAISINACSQVMGAKVLPVRFMGVLIRAGLYSMYTSDRARADTPPRDSG